MEKYYIEYSFINDTYFVKEDETVVARFLKRKQAEKFCEELNNK